MKKILALTLILASMSTAKAANVAQGFIYSGQVLTNSGEDKVTSTVDITFDILAPNGCLLYEEKQSGLDLSKTNGKVQIPVGTQVSSDKRTANDPGYSLEDIFLNSKTFPPTASCQDGYVSKSGDVRSLRVKISVAGSPTLTLSPDLQLSTMGGAFVAQSLQGKHPSDFIAVENQVTQESTDLLTNGQDASSLHNHDSLYLKKTASPNFANAGVTSVGSSSTSVVNKDYLSGQLLTVSDSVTALNSSIGTLQNTVSGMPSKSFIASAVTTGTSKLASQASVNTLNSSISSLNQNVAAAPTKDYLATALAPVTTANVKAAGDITTIQGQAPSKIANYPGTILLYAGPNCPVGYVAADGKSYVVSSYSSLAVALYDSANTRYLYGNADSTHFNVPDLRGQFLRGFDSTGVRDVSYNSRTHPTSGAVENTVGSYESDSFQGHYHYYGNTPSLNFYAGGGGMGFQISNTWNGVNLTPYPGNPTNDGAHGDPRTGLETRPKNAMVQYCIKY